MLLAVAIRSRIRLLTAQWMIQAWYLQGSATEWPLK
ncbi:hypothetical protein FOTG_15242 [Fusarium oxysporum f. sp. vasinfectum 25433]|uniref:Uncharacterized protein n=1 Tax=Fusarium oxysporum f. sp. vasinfectum 25433 TaxID=1089449 RepID=X0L693_FUSOX|nr:hypothetical protein FOTG_15242 [Fusarium oxysporum f. sp. vasinfectum 25433]